jgi:two-component system cell cycle sensor histidine kinase/response regulator CckA
MAERLWKSEVQLLDAQRLAKVGSFEFQVDSGKLYWSEEISRIFGASSRGPLDFPTLLMRVLPNDRDKVLESDRKVRSTHGRVETEYRIVRPDGEVRFVRSIVEGIRNYRGELVRLAGATQDVTDQILARELLCQSEQRLRNAERLAHLGHWQWHLKSNQLVLSEECLQIFGQPPNYIPSLGGVLQALIPEDKERLERETGRRLAEKKGGAIEFRIARPDSELRTVRSVSEMLLDEEGQPASFFGACQDITDERRAQEESVARQKLESVGTLAGGIAHDFNNLLGGVLAQAELALAELVAGSNPEAELKAIRDMALRGSEIVRELMIYAGKESAIVGPIDVSQVVKEMLELLKVSVSKHAVLEVDLSTDVIARGNAAQIRQMVMNIVTNASEAIGDRDGVIGVSTRSITINSDSGLISGGVAEGDYVQLEVSDTGHGMSLETQAKVFDPFFTTKSSGHGLGLAIVQGLVRSLGGSIHLTSELGKGTTIRILLPGAETAAGSARDAKPSVESAYLNTTVLVVEDEQMLRQAVAKMLRKNRFRVLEAEDGSTAIELLRANKGTIDVILLDMTIPGALPAQIVFEAGRSRPETKVLLTSAYSRDMIAGTINAAQVCGFIRKPFQLAELVEALRRAVAIKPKQ